MRWPWEWKSTGADEHATDAAEVKACELEERAESVARTLRAKDPWAGRLLDVIHGHTGEPHAR